ncbi:hypothetical protein ACVGX7_25190 [Enterobacter hormaechei]|nr:hypothetical protein [Enterobacter hormaechei subsp. steigerwaltii]HAV1935145.1 hypothetical protein [Enterobacter hormaechei subsp. steigerwaltii]HEM7461460.1 hypothetical protein [Enterobacter hormaechei]
MSLTILKLARSKAALNIWTRKPCFGSSSTALTILTLTRELCGCLDKTFGIIHHRLISVTHEALMALSVTINGFEKIMNTSKQRGLTIAVFLWGRPYLGRY